MKEVQVRDRLVWLTIPDRYELDATNAFTPEYARELGAALVAAADEAQS